MMTTAKLIAALVALQSRKMQLDAEVYALKVDLAICQDLLRSMLDEDDD